MKNILWALGYLRERKLKSVIGMILIGISMVLELMQTFLPRYIVDELVYGKELDKTVIMLIMLLTIHVGVGFLFFITGKIFHEIFYYWRGRIINDLFCKMQEIKLVKLDGEKIGKLTMIVGDVEGMGEDLYWIPYKVFDVIKILIIAIWIGYKSIFILMMILSVSILSWMISNIFFKKIRMNQNNLIDARYTVHEKIDEAVNGTREIIAYGTHGYFSCIIKKEFDKYLTCFKQICNDQGMLEIITGLLKWVGIIGTILVSWKMTRLEIITIGTFYALYQFSNQFLDSFKQNIDNIVSFIKTDIKIGKIRNSMDQYEIVDRYKGIELREDINSIDFENAVCGYKERGFQYNFTEYIRVGKKNALIGKSGSGKSTIVDILDKNLDILGGKCLVNKKYELSEIQHVSWLSKVAVVFQESYLFNASIRDNITMGKSVPDNVIWDICSLVCIDEYIKSLPNGLDEEVSDRGANMSGGQRQRIALARALVRQPELLILDEATSSLDEELQNKVQSNIDRLLLGRTMLVVAHRLSAVQNADYYIDLDNISNGGIAHV